MAAPSPLVQLSMHADDRGKLISVEALRDVPFAIGRVYYIVGRDGASRGFHAHRTLQQLMICVYGSCRILLDDGRSRSDYRLDQPNVGLFVGAMTWREMHDFAPDSVLLVLASDPYDDGDYIRDYDEFLRAAGTA